MNTAIILKSHRPGKKFDAIVDGRKIVSFGAKGYEDFTTRKNEDKTPMTAGFYSRWLLWNLPNLEDSLKDMNDRFKDKKYRFVLRE